MIQRLILSQLALLLPFGACADVWQDPETKVNYEYTVEKSEASVKGGTYYSNGSPDATGDIAILDKFTVGGNEYIVTSIGNYAFYSCSGLTSVNIGNSVTSIGEKAFSGCSGLTSVTIPNSVTSIGDGAFWSCSGLTSVTIPNSVTSIGECTFNGCSSLTSVTIPNSVTTIGKLAFYCCSGLTSVTIPNSVTSIGGWAFEGCRGLTSVTIGNSVTSIGKYAFRYCSGLTSITIGNSVTSIGGSAFEGCRGLTSVTIPNSVTSIGSSAFYGCRGLTSITIPNSVTSIGGSAFSGCSSLTSVTIPNSVTSIGGNAFYGCTLLTSIEVESGNTVYDSRDNCNAIIETASNTLIIGCQKTVIPNSVTSIGFNAFYGCTTLTSVTIPNSVTSIGDYAFKNCSGLTSITIGNSVTSIGSGAFEFCSGLPSVTIPNSVTSIGGNAFYGCSGLTSVTIGNSVTSIGRDAFSYSGIFNNQPDGVYYVDKWLCGYKGKVDEETPVVIKDDTRGIVMLPDVETIVIPSSIETFCEKIENLTKLKYLTLDGKKVLKSLDLSKSDQLISVVIGNNVDEIPLNAFKDRKALKTVLLGYGLKSIEANAFNGCESLEKIRIPNGTEQIGFGAFQNCSALTTVTIPNSAADIEVRAFANDLSLTSVNSLIAIPKQIDESVFGCYDNNYDTYTIYYIATLYVPRGRSKLYQNVSAWKLFAGIEEKDIAYELTYVLEGKVYKSMEIQPGIVITPEPDPVKDGYIFGGWYTVPANMPDHDVIVYGNFIPYSTGIEEVKQDNSLEHKVADKWCSLDGRRLQSRPTKTGIYINNGRKVVVR